MLSLKCSEWLGLLECSWFYFPSEYTTAFSILWFCLNVIELSLKLQFNRLHSLTSILSIKMRTFWACGGVRTHPVHPPPWLRAWFYPRFSRSIRSLSLSSFFFSLRIFIWARCSTYSDKSFLGTIYLSEYFLMASLFPLTNILSSNNRLIWVPGWKSPCSRSSVGVSLQER